MTQLKKSGVIKMQEYFGAYFEVLEESLEKYNNGFDNPYEALKFINTKWDLRPDPYVARLLVVIEKNYEQIAARYAFFQFTDSQSCDRFINNKEEIQWSNSYTDRVWNGDAKMMD